ncbi:MAG: TIGR04282 family arsenosugar biosynthesis glycosyltransferase [Pseudomonadales bacterium]|nr:TIGR04282 family arsenosugar biosynthesis glycosyltransferase [Pseudomonadales bacterium]
MVESQIGGTVILLFSKAPIPGQVKTRLIPKVGAEGAAKIHQILLEKVLETVLSVVDAKVQLWVANHPQHSFIKPLRERFGIEVCQQQGHDLGERMKFAVDLARMQYRRVILIGGDCLSVSPEYIQQSIDLMAAEEVDLVLGPAEDGGYVMMGLTCQIQGAELEGLFSNIEWGGPKVLSQTLDKANSFKLKVKLLDRRWDVDRWEDVERAVTLGLLPEFIFSPGIAE